MPLYDMKCIRCMKVQEIFCKIAELDSQRCECGGELKNQLSLPKDGDWFKPHVNYDFNGTPIEVRSRSHMKELCRKFNVTSRALGDVRNISEI